MKLIQLIIVTITFTIRYGGLDINFNTVINSRETLDLMNQMYKSYYLHRWYSCEYSVDQPLWFCLSVCDSVCLSVSLQDKTKTAESTVTKLGTEIVHQDISPTNVKRSKVKVTKCKSIAARILEQPCSFHSLLLHVVRRSNGRHE